LGSDGAKERQNLAKVYACEILEGIAARVVPRSLGGVFFIFVFFFNGIGRGSLKKRTNASSK